MEGFRFVIGGTYWRFSNRCECKRGFHTRKSTGEREIEMFIKDWKNKIHGHSNFVPTLVCSRNVSQVIHKLEIQESHTGHWLSGKCSVPGPLIGLVSWDGLGFQVMCI